MVRLWKRMIRRSHPALSVVLLVSLVLGPSGGGPAVADETTRLTQSTVAGERVVPPVGGGPASPSTTRTDWNSADPTAASPDWTTSARIAEPDPPTPEPLDQQAPGKREKGRFTGPRQPTRPLRSGPSRPRAAASTGVTPPGTPLNRFQSFTLPGGYVAAGIGMRNRGYGTIALSGIPDGSTVRAAYLYWDLLADAESPSFAQGQFGVLVPDLELRLPGGRHRPRDRERQLPPQWLCVRADQRDRPLPAQW